MAVDREKLRAAYEAACRDEIEALKPGNVHVFADGHGMAAAQFVESARVSSGPLTDPGLSLGERILDAVRATRAAVGVNTNLGILLLCAPLIAAAELASIKRGAAANQGVDVSARGLRASLRDVLRTVTMDDTSAVFAAIAHASPGGLGEAEDDVRKPPTIGLIEAMGQAAERDSIARQYVTGFADVFEIGLAALNDAGNQGEKDMWPCIFAYMRFLSAFPDSHIARKFGADVALWIQKEAVSVEAELRAMADIDLRKRLLTEFDNRLKKAGINPGTSADLTVSCLLVARLRDNLHIAVDDA